MEKEFNLSDKIWKEKDCKCSHINIENVQEFIRLLKELDSPTLDLDDGKHYIHITIEDIDNLAGDKLKENLRK